MVSTQKDFEKLATLYMEILKQVMKLHNVKEVAHVRNTTKEHFFDRIVLTEDEKLEVYKYGLERPFDSLHYDFTVDYATCLAYIEHDLYLAQRKGKAERGMKFKFNNK